MSTELTLGEAAKAVARGTTTIREWAQNGAIKAKRNTLGHWLIDRDALLAYASTEGLGTGPRRPRGAEALSGQG
jgi:excisionase family DNA binding protein